ncbi:hypothetical protein FDP41_001081 [Naegleria fowleri]|uniref:Zn(2)-C6 fungal-type domain-containing protein n=1 Tax=Naegleria fowleri TaxID=5763 RepID=A0A6A5C201_NAEFO|nr:uncharacterized protein FDP41_001081 [Naegleria fowleri]KAF0979928.1 hypothetical protein FDP41_001081 [Naegleria fowleri]CAG4712608.1 unnamed protein product [Naegleria fowleri]
MSELRDQVGDEGDEHAHSVCTSGSLQQQQQQESSPSFASSSLNKISSQPTEDFSSPFSDHPMNSTQVILDHGQTDDLLFFSESSSCSLSPTTFNPISSSSSTTNTNTSSSSSSSSMTSSSNLFNTNNTPSKLNLVSSSIQSPLEVHNQNTSKSKTHSKTKTPRKPYVKRACVNCKQSHAACDDSRPCKRCVSLKIEDQCVDAVRKKPSNSQKRKDMNELGDEEEMNSESTRTTKNKSEKKRKKNIDHKNRGVNLTATTTTTSNDESNHHDESNHFNSSSTAEDSSIPDNNNLNPSQLGHTLFNGHTSHLSPYFVMIPMITHNSPPTNNGSSSIMNASMKSLSIVRPSMNGSSQQNSSQFSPFPLISSTATMAPFPSNTPSSFQTPLSLSTPTHSNVHTAKTNHSLTSQNRNSSNINSSNSSSEKSSTSDTTINEHRTITATTSITRDNSFPLSKTGHNTATVTPYSPFDFLSENSELATSPALSTPSFFSNPFNSINNSTSHHHPPPNSNITPSSNPHTISNTGVGSNNGSDSKKSATTTSISVTLNNSDDEGVVDIITQEASLLKSQIAKHVVHLQDEISNGHSNHGEDHENSRDSVEIHQSNVNNNSTLDDLALPFLNENQELVNSENDIRNLASSASKSRLEDLVLLMWKKQNAQTQEIQDLKQLVMELTSIVKQSKLNRDSNNL